MRVPTLAVVLACLATTASAAFPRSARAQTFAGELLESTIARPLRGYPVRLELLRDSTAYPCDSTLTDDRGLFQLGGQGGGRYLLRFGPASTFLERTIALDSVSADTTVQRRYALDVVHAEADGSPTDLMQPVVQPRAPIRLRYPDDMLGMGIETELVVRFIIDDTGHAVPGTLYFAKSANPSFERGITEFVRTTTWTPARVAGIAVPQLVVVPFTFSIVKHGVPPK